MTDFRKRAMRVIAFIATFACGIARAEPAGDAAGILSATGVQGGLIVHIGCGDGTLTAALRANDTYLVHGLAVEADVEKARDTVRSKGLYGKVSIEPLAGAVLPYVDNLANLVVAEDLGAVPMDEVMRVLCPNGVAYVKKDGTWTKTVKPRPKEIDEWTHYLHKSDNNCVAQDSVVGPPRHYQWIGGPPWSRHHDHMASMSACVSAGGRLFYIMDEGPIASIRWPSKWFLVARDAFNGTILWKRPIDLWNTQFWPLKSGPAQLPRRLVAVGDRVYVTLGLNAPVTELDAATGKTLRTYEGSEGTEELLASEGVLFLQVCDAPIKRNSYRQKFTYVWDNSKYANETWAWDGHKRRLLVVQADTGKLLWKKDYPIAPLTLGVDARRACFYDGEKVVSLERKTGRELWASEKIGRRSAIPTGYSPTLVMAQDVVLFSGGDKSMTAVSAETGKTLWTAKHPPSGHNSPEDLLVINGLVWSGAIAQGSDSGIITGYDLHTGDVKVQFPPDVQTYWFHHRCYRSRATEQYYLSSRTGIEFIDLAKKSWEPHHWVRGGCLYGIMPCNGMVYAPPQSCGCYLESKLNGFSALAADSPTRRVPKEVPDEGRLQRGPAYGEVAAEAASPGDWPTYRHDAERSGFTRAAMPSDLKLAWKAEIGGRLSSLTAAGGRLFVADVDAQAVRALDAATGKPLWSYTAGGRVDSPPTIHQGRVLFGSADGWVYCLRASDGKLAWRFRAAPLERRMVANEQVESVWPVPGSILVRDGAAWCVAGRSMFLDGGLRLLKLDPATGNKLLEKVLDDIDPETGKNLQVKVKALNMPVSLPDVLSADGQYLYMRSQRFDLQGNRQEIAPREPTDQKGVGEHLFCMIGLLDDSWFHRSYWTYGRSTGGGYGGWFRAGRAAPTGRIMVFDDTRVYGFARKPEFMVNASILEYHLYASSRGESSRPVASASESAPPAAGKGKVPGKVPAKGGKKNIDSSDWKFLQDQPMSQRTKVDFDWSQERLPLLVRAMVLADKTLFLAGPPDVVDEQKAFFEPDDRSVTSGLARQVAVMDGQEGCLLRIVSARDGKRINEYKLESAPVFDGMIVAGGRLYLPLRNGKIICLSK